jgi:hypothetical protein
MRVFAGAALKCEGTIVLCEEGEAEGHVLIVTFPEEDNGTPETNS